MKINLVTILIVFLVKPITLFANINNEYCYSRDQVDSIVAAEVKRQVDTLMINYKIEKAFNSKWESYIDRQNWFITKHNEEMSDRYTWIGLLFTLLAAGFGVVGPLMTNNRFEKKFEKQIKDEFDLYKRQIEESLFESKKSINDSILESKKTINEMIEKRIDDKIDSSKKEIDKHVEEVERQLKLEMRHIDEGFGSELFKLREQINSFRSPEDVKEDASHEEKKIHELLSRAYEHYSRKEYKEAFELYLKAANRGDASAQFYIGEMYYRGLGTERDEYEASKWFVKSAEQNYADAQYMLGELYQAGLGVVSDSKKSDNWYRKAYKNYNEMANNGDARAEYQLGEIYESGRGIKKDFNEAKRWYRLSAKHGYARAQYYLGMMCLYGLHGMERNLQRASELLREAAAQGHEYAQKELKKNGWN